MSDAVDRTYARALVEATGSSAATVRDELLQLAAIAHEAPAEWAALTGPGISTGARRNALRTLLADANPATRNLALTCVDNGRLGSIPGIAAEFDRIVREQEGLLDVHVTSAVELPPDLRTAIEERLSKNTGRRVQLHAAVDPEIIGGLVVRHGDTLVDTSLRGRLEQLRLDLRRPAASGGAAAGTDAG